MGYSMVHVKDIEGSGPGGAVHFVRRELGKRLRIRHTPEVEFRYDKGLDATDRVAQLLDEERRRASTPSGDAGEGGEEPE